jgi:hypothetical protein
VVCCVSLLLPHRFFAWDPLRLHDRLAQLDFVRIWPAEVDALGQRQPGRVCPLDVIDRLAGVRREVRCAEDVRRAPCFRDQLPISPPSSFVITMQDERGRPPSSPSGQELNFFGLAGSLGESSGVSPGC